MCWPHKKRKLIKFANVFIRMVKNKIFSHKFNEIIPLDKWKISVITKIKSTIPDELKGKETIAPKDHESEDD